MSGGSGRGTCWRAGFGASRTATSRTRPCPLWFGWLTSDTRSSSYCCCRSLLCPVYIRPIKFNSTKIASWKKSHILYKSCMQYIIMILISIMHILYTTHARARTLNIITMVTVTTCTICRVRTLLITCRFDTWFLLSSWLLGCSLYLVRYLDCPSIACRPQYAQYTTMGTTTAKTSSESSSSSICMSLFCLLFDRPMYVQCSVLYMQVMMCVSILLPERLHIYSCSFDFYTYTREDWQKTIIFMQQRLTTPRPGPAAVYNCLYTCVPK